MIEYTMRKSEMEERKLRVGEKRGLTAFGKLVRIRLIERDMTMTELSERVGSTKDVVSRVLHGGRGGSALKQAIMSELDLKEEYTD